ncbi:MAG: hypothetical protein Tsb0026_16840 [Sulfuricaulis sp.]
MLDQSSLKDLLHQSELSNTDRLLLCLGVQEGAPKTVAEITKIATSAGLAKAKGWNISSYLAKSKGLAIRTDTGWELTLEGKKRVATLAGSLVNTPIPRVAAGLRSLLSKITNKDTAAFLDEAIRCYEARLYRAAVVLSWVGATSVLYDHVIAHKLSDFNAEASRRDSKWRNAKKKDDLARMTEHDFLQVLNAISVIGKSVKEELEGCLKFRNGCGHPNSLQIGEARVSAHIETLMLNVFSVF